MKKLLILFAIVLIFSASLSNAQIASYSGGTVNIGVVPAATATAYMDSVTDIHTKLQLRAKTLADTLTATHTKLQLRASTLADTLTGIHTKLQLRALTLADTLTAINTNLTTGATQDTLTAIHTKLQLRASTLADTSTAIHTKLQLRATTLADTLTAISTNLMTGATQDTLTDIHTTLKTLRGATGVFLEQADVAFTIASNDTANIDILDLNTANTRYLIRGLFLKNADPEANTVTVSLEMLVNNVATVVDTFAITTSNYTVYYKLPSLFELEQLAGDDIHIYIRSSAGSYAMTGQYSYAKTLN